VISVFQELNDQGITIVMVTHEPDLIPYAKRVIEMRDGVIRKDYLVENRRQAKEDLKDMVILEEEI
jgi:putative ABC transport system ATP-binding protein